MNFGKLIQDLFKSGFQKWLESASDKELSEGYEERRLKNLENGGWDRTPEMKRIDNEMRRRSDEKWEKSHKGSDSNYRWTDKNRWEKD